jgi:leader peptidase (prepilin peptidase)/N-methyltransferase
VLLSNTVLIILSLWIAYLDLTLKIIPNWIVIPGIIAGLILGQHYFWCAIMFVIVAVEFSLGMMAGGDVKLFSMFGAFLGVKALFIFLLTLLFMRWFVGINRKLKIVKIDKMPVAPFALVSSLFCMW